MPKKFSHGELMFLIKRFIAKDKINFPLEMKMAKLLLQQYPDKNFWEGFWSEYGCQRTLLDLRSKYWQEKLAFYEKRFIMSATEKNKIEVLGLDSHYPKNPEIQENFLGELEEPVKPKPKTLKEFLK